MKKQLLLSLLTMLLPLMVNAEAVKINGIYYNLINKGNLAEVTQNPNKYTGKVDIPSSVVYNGVSYSVTSIGSSAFYNCSSLTSVTIPNSVTSIGRSAFSYCIGLTSVTIPNSVTSIEQHAFSDCRGLASVSIPNSVTSIGTFAFSNCIGLTSVTIPNSITSIEMHAFAGCRGLTSVTIPNSVTSICDDAFFNCTSLTAVYITDLEAWCKIEYSFNGCSNPLFFAHHLYLNGKEIKDLVIPNSVTSIKKDAFNGCSGLTSVTIPNSVTSIGKSAFNGCTGLTSVTIPNSVTSIGEWAFIACSGLTSITIGSGIRGIGGKAFANCPELKDVYCYAKNVPSTNTDAFDGSYIEYATLHVPESAINTYKNTEPWNSFKSIVKLDIPKYKLVYFVDFVEYKSYDVEFGATITPEPVPTKEGYTFSGWSEIPETMPAENIAITGTFTINKYKLTYQVDGVEYKTIDVEYGATIDPEETPTKEGYTFSGWSEIPETMPAHDVTIVGTYSANLHTLSVDIIAGKGIVTYNENNVTAGNKEFEVTEGTTALLKIIPASNYTLSALTVNGEDAINDVTNGVLMLANIKTDMTVNVSFERTSDNYIVTMASAMSTLCVDEDLDFTNVSGLEAYIGSGFDMETGTLLMTRVYDVPSGTGLLLKGEPGTYDVPYSTSHSIYVNLLKGLTADTILEQTSEDCINYLLSDGAQGLGFYAVNVATVLEAGKAYLPIPTAFAGSRQCISIAYGETTTTGITDVFAKNDIKYIYGPNGNRFNKLQKGMNIVVMKDGTTKKIIKK